LGPSAIGEEPGLGFERGQREREGWSARVPLLVGFARKREEKKKKGRKGGPFGRNSFEF
jgi:hypothetical protein